MTLDVAEMEMTMGYTECRARTVSLDTVVKVILFVILYVLASAIPAGCSGSSPTPPDLSKCTCLEIHYSLGAVPYPFGDAIARSIFSAEEREFMDSFDTWVLDDRELIKTFAQNVSRGVYAGQVPGLATPGPDVVCYRGSERVTSFNVRPGSIVIDHGRMFKYPLALPDLMILEPPQMRPLRLRWECAHRVGGLYSPGHLPRTKISSYSAPDCWCDVIVETLQQQRSNTMNGPVKRVYSDVTIAAMFRCPIAGAHARGDGNEPRDEVNGAKPGGQTVVRSWISDYALNPNCEPNSPADTVLLFETKAGWNQHGGPELFTFDNHDPRGGCVLLNDGTVRFIRTEEELHALRWK
jgi:hypothetical protein